MTALSTAAPVRRQRALPQEDSSPKLAEISLDGKRPGSLYSHMQLVKRIGAVVGSAESRVALA